MFGWRDQITGTGTLCVQRNPTGKLLWKLIGSQNCDENKQQGDDGRLYRSWKHIHTTSRSDLNFLRLDFILDGGDAFPLYARYSCDEKSKMAADKMILSGLLGH